MVVLVFGIYLHYLGKIFGQTHFVEVFAEIDIVFRIDLVVNIEFLHHVKVSIVVGIFDLN